uniref:mucin-17 n=1 Tax=Jaculus jaculus TaxID=51337 RepID=UPI001E1B40E1|nr:mucin-17 [Jaculus jaculus]
MSGRTTLALCALALLLQSLPRRAAAREELTESGAVWDGGGCDSQQNTQGTQCVKMLRSNYTEKCLNGGVWTGNACQCPTGFTGELCEKAVIRCQNGGTWDGVKCICPSLYYGPRCETVVESLEIEQTVSASVEVSVTVTSEEYSNDLQDRDSEKFKNFSRIFTEQMNKIYAGIPEYEGVIIRKLSRGSIVVDYEVILKANYTPGYEDTFQNVSTKLKEKIENATQQQIGNVGNCSELLCFNSTATKVEPISITSYDPNEECRKAGGEYADFFTVEYKDGKYNCVSPCKAGFKASKNCHYGTCELRQSGPRCLCLSTDTHWYSGESCNRGIQKSLVYGLGGAGIALLLVILVIFLVLSIHYRREVERQKARVSHLYNWHEEEGRATPGTFRNVGFDVREEREDYVHLGSVYSNFQPSLRHIDPERKIQIQRPQVVMTAL